MKSLDVKYRTWYKGSPPRPIKLEIPGWAGENRDHSDGAKPQPWHCPPFVDGSTYGLELIYPFDAECRVSRRDGRVIFEGDFAAEAVWTSNQVPSNDPPFLSFAPDHYGMTSALDIMPPEDYLLRIEPHPRFYTDQTGTCPIAVAGNLSRWWSRIFFVAFKSPREGEVHIFRKGEPYAHALIIPIKPHLNVKEMTFEEKRKRAERDEKIDKLSEYIAKHSWKDHIGHRFNDKYKVLSSAHATGGEEAIEAVINKASKKKESRHTKKPKKILPKKLLKSNETPSTQKKNRP